MSIRKPIRVFYSTLSGRFYASQHYREEVLDDGTSRFTITGVKWDVTDDIAFSFREYKIDPSKLPGSLEDQP